MTREQLIAHHDMHQILVDEKKLKWDSARFRGMLAKHGGHRTAEILLALEDSPLECGDAPELTAEYHVVLPKLQLAV